MDSLKNNPFLQTQKNTIEKYKEKDNIHYMFILEKINDTILNTLYRDIYSENIHITLYEDSISNEEEIKLRDIGIFINDKKYEYWFRDGSSYDYSMNIKNYNKYLEYKELTLKKIKENIDSQTNELLNFYKKYYSPNKTFIYYKLLSNNTVNFLRKEYKLEIEKVSNEDNLMMNNIIMYEIKLPK